MSFKYRVAMVGIGPDSIGTAVVDNEKQAMDLVNGTPIGLRVFGRFIKWITPWTEYFPTAPEVAKPSQVTWPITEAEHQFHEQHSGGAKPEKSSGRLCSCVECVPDQPEPETERAELVNALLSLLDDQTLGLEEDQEDIIKEAAALLGRWLNEAIQTKEAS